MLGSVTAGLGLAAPFVIYGVALLVAAAVVFVSLRHSALAAPEASTEPACRCGRCCATGHIARRCSPTSRRAGRRSACASRWCRCSSSRCWVAAPGIAGLALATFAIGNVSAVIPSGYLSDRVGRRKLLIVGLTVSAVATVLVGFTSSLPVFLAAAYVTGAATGIFISPQQAAVADIVGSKARGGTAVATFQMMADLGVDRRLAGGRPGRRARVVRRGVRGQRRRSCWSAAVGWVFAPETAACRPFEPTPARALGPEAGGEVP